MKSQIAAVAAVSTILATALMTTGAQAQLSPSSTASQNIGAHASKASQQADEQEAAKKVKANEKAYDAVMKNLPDKQYDPWHGVR
jgi:hypothetical protein